jgi:hypothetical protein
MRKIILLLVACFSFAVTTLVSCDSGYGKKIKIEGTKGEVFYKPGIAGAEAKKVGEFLKEIGFIGNEKGVRIQVIKEHEGLYTVRFVYDKDYFEKTEGLEDAFKQYGAKISKAVFHGANVNIALADDLP